jgi:predicted molibdopterin-dependent oxidoreductase YjgC
VAGLATTFGSGAMTNSINEIEQAQVIVVVGSNTTEAHPQVARRIYDAIDQGAKLIVIDPRRTRLAEQAHIHLAIRPGTDIPLMNAMMRVILDENLADDLFIEMRTENFLALRDMLNQLDPEETAALTGVPLALISAAAQTYARAQKAVICYCLGITQHICGTSNVQAIANLAMLAGHIEKEFTGVDPLRGQNNVQGACDMGALPGLFPSYQPVGNPEFREKFEAAWGTTLSPTPGLSLMEMTHGGPGGAIRAMLIMGENPMLSDPTSSKVEATLRGLEFLAVCDLFLTETADLADVVFPAATFAEKSGTFTSTERRVQMVRQVIPPLGSCRSDSAITIALARAMGFSMEYDSPAEIMEEITLLSPIYGGMFHDRLESSWGLQWPCWDRTHPGTPFLHKYFFTRGRGHFMPGAHVPASELPDPDYPLLLNTGRVYHQYHTGTMTRNCSTLDRESLEALLEVNPQDASGLKIRSGDRVNLSSRRGSVTVRVRVTEQVPPGSVYTTFHFSDTPINRLTIDARDPKAQCPEFKVCAVRVEKVAA